MSEKCVMCPRKCGADRASGEIGFCGCGENIQIAKVMLHKFEEPCISGERGSGAIFFYGCNLRCGYCQNAVISNYNYKKPDGKADKIQQIKENGESESAVISNYNYKKTDVTAEEVRQIKENGEGESAVISNYNYKKPDGKAEEVRQIKEYTASELADIMLELQAKRAHNINLVTAGHYINEVSEGIKIAKTRGLKIPIIYNTSAYETVEAIKKLDKLVDVYLPDYKYFSDELAFKYSRAPDYPSVARAAIAQMLEQKPTCIFDEDGMITSGVIIRHLVLPSNRADSMKIVSDIAQNFNGAYLSLMNQYTPDYNRTGDAKLDKRVTTFEYNSVLNLAVELNLNGYMQFRDSAQKTYTPEF